MNLRNNIFIFCICLLYSCKKEETGTFLQEPESYLIEFDEFKTIASQEHVKVIDFRKPDLYKKGHIQDALNVWRSDIEDPNHPYKGVMACRVRLEKLFSKLGIRNGDLLIVYDDNGLCDSSRLWWILQNYDYHNVRLLHGGFSQWKEAGNVVTEKITQEKASKFKLSKNPSFKLYASKEMVLEAIDKKTKILDTRTHEEFVGKRQKNGAFKGGRIQNSAFIDWASAIEWHGDRKMKKLEDLKKIYNSLLKSENDTLLVYCHSGVRSAHTTFVLTQLLGYKNIKNYDGSWVEWSYYKHLPYEQDSITTKFK